MSDNRDKNDTPLPRRVHREIGRHSTVVNREIQDQVDRFNELCGPVTIRKVTDEDSDD
jgi:hypothetical protein